jgi:hypothetical protein
MTSGFSNGLQKATEYHMYPLMGVAIKGAVQEVLTELINKPN